MRSKVLTIFKQGRTTELHTDASKYGYGAVLQEAEDGKLHPIHYMSKKKSFAEEKYSSYELEFLAVVGGFEKIPYLFIGPGDRMKHALSRYPVMMIVDDTITARLQKAQLEDENICSLKQLLNNNLTRKVIANCVPCILSNKKCGRKEGYLNPIPKGDGPLSTYHVGFIGPLPSTNKRYQHIFTVIDAFTKFTWLYPIKTVSTRDALDKLKLQQKTFGNLLRLIRDRGPVFTSKAFNDYCTEEGIQHLQIATGVPRGNGQIERIHRTLIPVLTKLSLEDATKWYRYVDKLQRILNSTTNRSKKWTPFELLTGVEMKIKRI
ncbi:hypothetical protein CEXT_379901 [Caerostris extrusa]|uniref:Integrase catalytic domain-containing protein n=1 Tax=Caerostris extrusa TaxID=172846 RepID=A0AAV4VI39_CAEEX|nr:hypothetical protein CEXT_379901 [Caerostris extrusa]